VPALNLGIQLSSLRLPFRQAVPLAARLGAKGVEIDARRDLLPAETQGTALRQVRKLLDDYNLTVCAVSYPTRRGYNVADDLDRRVAGTKAALKMAYDLGCGIVINHVGKIPSQADTSDWKLLVDALTDIATYGQHVGGLLAADTGSDDPADMQRLLSALPPQGMLVNFNPGQLLINGFSADAALSALGTSVVHVHAQDGVRDLARGRGLNVELGRGAVDFPSLLGNLVEYGYRGYFTVLTERADEPAAELGRAIQYLKGL